MLYTTPEAHAASVRDLHPSHRQLHIKPISQPLYVVCAISNPQRYWARYKHYNAFERHIADSGAILYTVELALRDRHFEVTSHCNPRHIQLRSTSECWHKENLLNIGVSRFPADWHYGAYIDADLHMCRPDWVAETLHQLQHYQWLQLFATASDLQPDHSCGHSWPSFVKVWRDGHKRPDKDQCYDKGGLWGAPGGAWAWRREAFDACGGLLDICILGSGDYHVAVGLAGTRNKHPDLKIGSRGYVKSLDDWAERAKVCRQNIGYLQNHVLHRYHGSKANRGYRSRNDILRDYQYDPATDVRRDWQGVLNWTGNKPELEEAVRQYFRSRNEDEGVAV